MGVTGYQNRTEKLWSDFGAEQVKSGAKEWFLFIPLFLREREIDV